MGDLSKLHIALCQVEVVEAQPSCYENAVCQLMMRVKSTGAHLAVVSGPSFDHACPHLVAMNGAILVDEGERATVAVAGELYHVAVDRGRGCRDLDGCDFAVTSDVTPWTLEGKASDALAVPTICANPVGSCNAGDRVLAFDGASWACDAAGELVARLRDDFTGDFAPIELTAPRAGAIAPPCDLKLLKALVSTIRRFDAQVLTWHPKWVIGLSGGLDSSVVAALLALSFGAGRVGGYNLASRYNSACTKGNAHALSDALGIELRVGSIEKLVEATGATVEEYGYPRKSMSGLVEENVQARLRGHLLSTFAALEGGVVANNGNRVESALGYATLYGDAIGALAPIADLTKVQLFDLSRDINRVYGKEVIPANLIPEMDETGLTWDVAPSAELADGQLDPMKWCYHDWLVGCLLDGYRDARGYDGTHESLYDVACSVLESYAQDRLEGACMAKWVDYYGLGDPQAFVDDLEWVLKSCCNASFKRMQSPPGIRVASVASARGRDERQGSCEPSERYLELREMVLSMSAIG